MTTRRETELETENRMLREQVASLEKIIEQAARPAVQWNTVPGCAGYPWWIQWYQPAIWSSGANAMADTMGGSTLTVNAPSPAIIS